MRYRASCWVRSMPGSFKVSASRAVNDPEKAVLPAIIWTRVTGDNLTAYALSAGWWDWSVSLMWARRS